MANPIVRKACCCNNCYHATCVSPDDATYKCAKFVEHAQYDEDVHGDNVCNNYLSDNKEDWYRILFDKNINRYLLIGPGGIECEGTRTACRNMKKRLILGE